MFTDTAWPRGAVQDAACLARKQIFIDFISRFYRVRAEAGVPSTGQFAHVGSRDLG